jgi:hypothetical protein
MSYRSEQAIELEGVEVSDGPDVWVCSIKADVEVSSGTDLGDNGITSYGSGPWIESEVDIDSVEAHCYRIDKDGKEVEERRLEGQEALDFTECEEELIERAEEKHH